MSRYVIFVRPGFDAEPLLDKALADFQKNVHPFENHWAYTGVITYNTQNTEVWVDLRTALPKVKLTFGTTRLLNRPRPVFSQPGGQELELNPKGYGTATVSWESHRATRLDQLFARLIPLFPQGSVRVWMAISNTEFHELKNKSGTWK